MRSGKQTKLAPFFGQCVYLFGRLTPGLNGRFGGAPRRKSGPLKPLVKPLLATAQALYALALKQIFASTREFLSISGIPESTSPSGLSHRRAAESHSHSSSPTCIISEIPRSAFLQTLH
jgi:hypothetical protein